MVARDSWWESKDAVLQIVDDTGRKQLGSGSGIPSAHRRAPLSPDKVPLRPYKDPAREGIQSLRVTAQVLVRVTNRRNPHCSSLPQM